MMFLVHRDTEGIKLDAEALKILFQSTMLVVVTAIFRGPVSRSVTLSSFLQLTPNLHIYTDTQSYILIGLL